MEAYRFLNIPDSCFVGSTIYKKLFYENADLGTRDKAIFADVIEKIKWVYCLKPETINIPSFKDQVRDYPEIEVIEVKLKKDASLKRIAEMIMRTIPYPMLLVFKWEDKKQLYVAHQRINQNDSSKNTIEDFIATGWLDSKSFLFAKLDIKEMRFTNYYTLYSDLVDAISIYKVADIVKDKAPITGIEARELAKQIEEIDGQITSLRARLKKESQFNRKMELNIEIKKLEQKKDKLLEGAYER